MRDIYLKDKIGQLSSRYVDFSDIFLTNMKLSVRRSTSQSLNLNINSQVPQDNDPNTANQQQLQQLSIVY